MVENGTNENNEYKNHEAFSPRPRPRCQVSHGDPQRQLVEETGERHLNLSQLTELYWLFATPKSKKL